MAYTEHRTTSRILDILEIVSKYPKGLALSEIARLLEAPKSSIFPLVNTLSDRKYLIYNKREQRFSLGESLFIMGNRFVNESDILENIRTVLLSISEQTEETLYFGILSKLDVLYLIKADQYSKFRVMSNPGNKLPAYSTGYGKALLSQFSEEEIQSFYPEGILAPITENTIKTVAELNQQLVNIRKTGFSYEKGESNIGIKCIAVPICIAGKTIAGLSFAVPEFRYDSEKEKLFKELLLQVKRKIETIIATDYSQWTYN